jgi:tetratricopeptide (TPR) repeat protein
MALFLSVGTIMGQVDKAALKQAQKEAKAQMTEAQKISEAITAKTNEKTATEEEVMSECKKGQALIRKAIKSDAIAENKLGEAYKISADLALQPHNLMLGHAVNKEPFDTAFFYTNLKTMTNALQGEIKNTKVTKGEAGNEKYLKSKANNLAQCGDYYIYAAQFNGECKQYDKALEAYEIAMTYAQKYPEVADLVKLRVPNEQIAYYAFITAYEAKKYDKLDVYYDQAIQFPEGAVGVKQRKAVSYIERGDSAAWAKFVHEMTVKEPQSNDDFISMLIGYYLDKEEKGGSDVNLLVPYADEIIAADPNNLIAHYGKGYKFFKQEKYDEAFNAYLKCTEIKDDYFDAWFQCGLCKYRQALALNATVSSIKNQAEAKKAKENAKNLFGEAIPYFEKARDCAPDEPSKWAVLLRDCYDVTDQKDKAAEMDKLI